MNVDPSVMQQASQLWSTLDDLSQDPKAYADFIQNTKKDALLHIQKSKIVQAGFCVFSDGRRKGASLLVVLNMASSKAVAAPSDSLNVPILISDEKKFEGRAGTMILISIRCSVPSKRFREMRK